ncbi:MAG TPA: diadenylate cyclase CdaA [Nitrospiria bacterium]
MFESFPPWRWQDAVDVALVAAAFYWLLLILKGTRALQILVGLGLLLLASVVSQWAGFYTVDWLISRLWSQLFLVVVILFHPEIRRALAQIGRAFSDRSLSAGEETRTIEEIIRAVVTLAGQRTGAILVLERQIELKDIVEVGSVLDAKLSRELLLSLFGTQSPLHDGAVIIKGDRILAAGCFLPLTLGSDLSKMLGTRHRAALGVTEDTDAVVIVVSEETGAISIIVGGMMTRELDASSLRRVLGRMFVRDPKGDSSVLEMLKDLFPDRGR